MDDSASSPVIAISLELILSFLHFIGQHRHSTYPAAQATMPAIDRQSETFFLCHDLSSLDRRHHAVERIHFEPWLSSSPPRLALRSVGSSLLDACEYVGIEDLMMVCNPM